jgi:hypothetical protein
MKTKISLIGVLSMFLIFFFCSSCTQKGKESEKAAKIENTLKSVSFLYDSVKVEPAVMLSMLEGINNVIDSIGYPDAGYKLWLVEGDSVVKFRFLLEGYWPNQALYDTIHKNILYRNAFKRGNKIWSGINNISYHRFSLVK